MSIDPHTHADLPPDGLPRERGPAAGGAPYHRRAARHRGFDVRKRAPLLAIGAGLLALVLLLTVWYGRGTSRATRDLRAANAQVIEKRRQVEEARQLLEQRIAELRAAEAEVAVGAERLDVEMVRSRHTSTDAGDVAPLPDDPELRAQESLRRGDSALGTGGRDFRR